ncbi:MAG: glycosyltransferase [Fuerstiella sp.]
MRHLRILHCIASLNEHDGGTARSVPALAQAEAEHGADVRVWSSRPPTIDLSSCDRTRFESGDLRLLMERDWKPDLIHDHGLWLPSNHSCARLGRHQRIPRVVSPRGMLEPWSLSHRQFRKQVAWRLYQQRDLASCCGLHATSDSESHQIRRLGFRQPILALPNGVTLPTADVHPAPPARDGREILFLSRIHPVKGLPNLIAAWKQVAAPDWTLRIAGPDEDGHRAELQRQVAALGLQHNVRICEAVHSDQKWTLLQQADVVVLPSFSENFGIVVAEALGMGTPVITTTGTPWNEVSTRKCGWYVKPEATDLAIALRQAMACSRDQLQAMGARGRSWVRADFSWRDIGRRILSGYERLIGRTADSSAEAAPDFQTAARAA